MSVGGCMCVSVGGCMCVSVGGYVCQYSEPSLSPSHTHSHTHTERIQWACDMAGKQRKMITTRPRVKPVSLHTITYNHIEHHKNNV